MNQNERQFILALLAERESVSARPLEEKLGLTRNNFGFALLSTAGCRLY